MTNIDENIATVEMNGTVARIVPNQNEAYGETTLMLRDDNSDISFIFKVRVMPTQEEKYGTDIKYAAPKVVNGESHVVALKTNGTVWTWGRGTNNQLGDGSNSNDNYPLQVLGVNGSGFLEKIVDIAAGTNFSVALDADGNVYTWGYNSIHILY